MSLQRVRLNKNKDYVYCFLKEEIIEEEKCNHYEHNLKCEENGDYWGRTHRKGSDSGIGIQGKTGPVLNSCNYCLRQEEEYVEYVLPPKASKMYKQKHKKKKGLFGLW